MRTMWKPIDTSNDAREHQLEAYRAMAPEDRLRIAGRMSAEVRSLARSGVRARHPEAAEAEIDADLVRILLGPELAAAIQADRRLDSP